jgi:7-cyano-7-deazaguanine synthase
MVLLDPRKAFALVSGGMDSVVAFYAAHNLFNEVVGVTYDYGQLARRELEYARYHCANMRCEQLVVPFPAFSDVRSSLTQGGDHGDTDDPTLRGSTIPARNLGFVSVAVTLAADRGFGAVVAGAVRGDFHPDATPTFVERAQAAAVAALGKPFHICTPLADMRKQEVWKEADRMGVVEDVRLYTWSCYENEGPLHEWGYGCGECPSCVARAEGWREAFG